MPTASTIILGSIAAGGSALNIIQGANAKSEAKQAASAAAQSIAQMQEEDKFRNLQLPTLGLEMAQQNVQARQAQQLEGLRDIGAAGVLGGLTAINTQGQAQDLALAAQAQEVQYARDFAQAQNAQAIEQRNIARQNALEQQRLLGAQGAAAYGQQQINAGIQGLAQTAGSVMAQSLANKSLFNEQQAAKGLNPDGTLTGAQIQKNAQAAFAPQIKSMMPPSTKMQNVAPQLNQNYLAGLRPMQSQYENYQADILSGLRASQGQYENSLMADQAEFRRIFEQGMNNPSFFQNQ
jgi:hypothetical protein